MTGEPVSEPAAADGVLLEVDGIQRRLVFGFPALKVLEDDFGGIVTWVGNFNGGLRTKRLSAIETGVRAGLKHYELEPPNALHPFDLEASVASVMSGLLGEGWSDRVAELAKTVDTAFGQALPASPPKKAARAKPAKASAAGQPSLEVVGGDGDG